MSIAQGLAALPGFSRSGWTIASGMFTNVSRVACARYSFLLSIPIILGIHNAVNRKTESGRVLGEHQRISVMEAIKAVTINGAYQYFEEDKKGSIEVGKLADFVIIDKNPLEIPAEELETIKILETVKEGNTVFKL